MLKDILKIQGVTVLSKNEQKKVKGGLVCCNPIEQCCMPERCVSNCVSMGGYCNCAGCYWCYSDPVWCGCA